MGYYSRQYSIYLSEFLLCVAYTIIAPFYPGVAESKGVPIWLIGFIFSIDPLVGLPTSIFIGRNMKRLGRREVVVFGIGAGTLGMFFLGLVDLCETRDSVIILSFVSRTLAGIGAGCTMTAGEAILASEYPEEIETVIGRLEVSSGLGLLLGPLLGTFLSYYGIFFSFSIVTVLFLIFTPLSYVMIGKCKEYNEFNHSEHISMMSLAFKPIILLDAVVQFSLLFNLGFVIPVIELHLLTFGIGEILIGLIFSMYTLTYALVSIFGIDFMKSFNPLGVMFSGILLSIISFFLIGLWRNLTVIGIALGMMGVSGSIMYIPTIPHMINTAHLEYGYKRNDDLIDALSGITNFACNLGEIFGPITSGFITDYFNFQTSMTSMGGFYMAFGVIFILTSRIFRKKKSAFDYAIDSNSPLIHELKLG